MLVSSHVKQIWPEKEWEHRHAQLAGRHYYNLVASCRHKYRSSDGSGPDWKLCLAWPFQPPRPHLSWAPGCGDVGCCRRCTLTCRFRQITMAVAHIAELPTKRLRVIHLWVPVFALHIAFRNLRGSTFKPLQSLNRNLEFTWNNQRARSDHTTP